LHEVGNLLKMQNGGAVDREGNLAKLRGEIESLAEGANGVYCNCGINGHIIFFNGDGEQRSYRMSSRKLDHFQELQEWIRRRKINRGNVDFEGYGGKIFEF